MWRTYEAILRGSQLEWRETPPAVDAEEPVAVHVTILEKSPGENGHSGRQMAAALAQLAATGALGDVTDPSAWQREVRRERPLPERDE